MQLTSSLKQDFRIPISRDFFEEEPTDEERASKVVKKSSSKASKKVEEEEESEDEEDDSTEENSTYNPNDNDEVDVPLGRGFDLDSLMEQMSLTPTRNTHGRTTMNNNNVIGEKYLAV